MGDALEIIGLIALFLVGGFAFAVFFALIALRVFRSKEVGALIYASIAFKVAAVVWIGLFFWLGPVSVSVGALP